MARKVFRKELGMFDNIFLLMDTIMNKYLAVLGLFCVALLIVIVWIFQSETVFKGKIGDVTVDYQENLPSYPGDFFFKNVMTIYHPNQTEIYIDGRGEIDSDWNRTEPLNYAKTRLEKVTIRLKNGKKRVFKLTSKRKDKSNKSLTPSDIETFDKLEQATNVFIHYKMAIDKINLQKYHDALEPFKIMARGNNKLVIKKQSVPRKLPSSSNTVSRDHVSSIP